MKRLVIAVLFAAIASGQYTFLGEFCTSAAGTDTYACTLNSPLVSYQAGAFYSFKADVANTGAATINFSAAGAKTIVKVAGGVTTALADNDIRASQVVFLQYDGTNMQMQSTLGNASSGATGGLFAVNGQTGTYQVLAADFTACKTITVASGTFTVTLVASGSQPTTGQCVTVVNYGSGVVTIARSGQNINGGTASLTLAPASAIAPTAAFVVSDGTNYFANVTPSQVITAAIGTVTITNVLYPVARAANVTTSSSDNDMYTVPSGKNAIVGECQHYSNGSNSFTATDQFKRSGTYYYLASQVNPGANSNAAAILSFVMVAGDILSVHVDTLTSTAANVSCGVMEYDAPTGSNPFVASAFLSLANGNNTIFTVPASHSAMLLSSQALGMTGFGNQPGTIQCVNNSGSSRTISMNIVASGGSVAATNQYVPSQSLADKTRVNLAMPASMTAGDFVNVNTNAGTATQDCWVNYIQQ